LLKSSSSHAVAYVAIHRLLAHYGSALLVLNSLCDDEIAL
jgi:hypothetical protein